eukprot:419953-Rhodomonas_salina.1
MKSVFADNLKGLSGKPESRMMFHGSKRRFQGFSKRHGMKQVLPGPGADTELLAESHLNCRRVQHTPRGFKTELCFPQPRAAQPEASGPSDVQLLLTPIRQSEYLGVIFEELQDDVYFGRRTPPGAPGRPVKTNHSEQGASVALFTFEPVDIQKQNKTFVVGRKWRENIEQQYSWQHLQERDMKRAAYQANLVCLTIVALIAGVGLILSGSSADGPRITLIFGCVL